MPIFSLPSPYGIGTLGQAAYDFIDFLAKAEQKYWQILPVGPTSYGDSPYQSFSTFAGNPYFVDLDMLVEDGLLKKEEIEDIDWGCDAHAVDYGKIYENRFRVLKLAADRGLASNRSEYDAFCKENEKWLVNYALYMSVKKHFEQKSWTEWPEEEIRLHRPEACERYKELLKEDVELFSFIQFLFFGQWSKLREYARNHGISIIGDLPIYVAMDSADIWAEPEWFQLDTDNRPIEVSGVPPDYFNENGQLWGNPLYNWDAMHADGYGWWIRRVDGAAKLYDVLRIDHFRGFESYWAVPAGETTAKNGRWVKGPGMNVIGPLKKWFSNVSFIAEDLGYLTQEVRQFLAESEFPGMKVLEFAFNANEPSDYLPHMYERNAICYTGTHDNSPVMLWKEEADPADVQMARIYLGITEEDGIAWGMIRGGMRSVANLFVAQMQDYLELGEGSRVNIPGSTGVNWMWRMDENAIHDELADKIASMTILYGRSNN